MERDRNGDASFSKRPLSEESSPVAAKRPRQSDTAQVAVTSSAATNLYDLTESCPAYLEASAQLAQVREQLRSEQESSSKLREALLEKYIQIDSLMKKESIPGDPNSSEAFINPQADLSKANNQLQELRCELEQLWAENVDLSSVLRNRDRDIIKLQEQIQAIRKEKDKLASIYQTRRKTLIREQDVLQRLQAILDEGSAENYVEGLHGLNERADGALAKKKNTSISPPRLQCTTPSQVSASMDLHPLFTPTVAPSLPVLKTRSTQESDDDEYTEETELILSHAKTLVEVDPDFPFRILWELCSSSSNHWKDFWKELCAEGTDIRRQVDKIRDVARMRKEVSSLPTKALHPRKSKSGNRFAAVKTADVYIQL